MDRGTKGLNSNCTRPYSGLFLRLSVPKIQGDITTLKSVTVSLSPSRIPAQVSFRVHKVINLVVGKGSLVVFIV